MGRPSKPWYRSARGEWYGTVQGRQVGLGVTDPVALGAAWEALKHLLGGAAPAAATPPRVSAGDAVARFLAAKAARVKPHTLLCYSQHLKRFVEAVGARADLATLAADHIEASAGRDGWSASTRNGYLGAVGTMMRWAGCPLRIARPPKESRGADAVWTDQEFWMVYGAALGDFKPLLLVLRDTGARPSEAAGLTAGAVDWARGLARIKEHKTSGKGKQRIVHFPTATMGVLGRQRELYPAGFLFRQDDGKPFSGHSLSQRMMHCRERAGVGRPLMLYGLRHGFCTRALESGASNEQVAALVGNTPGVIQQHYGHLTASTGLMKEIAERAAKKTG